MGAALNPPARARRDTRYKESYIFGDACGDAAPPQV
jgi:hypothetical protein